MALGARHEQILRMIVGEGSLLALAGVAVGLAYAHPRDGIPRRAALKPARDVVTFVAPRCSASSPSPWLHPRAARCAPIR